MRRHHGHPIALLLAWGLLSIDPAAAQSLYVATAHRAVAPNEIAGRLYRVDPATAQSTLIGAVATREGMSVGITGMAEDPATGFLYGVTAGFSSPPTLVILNRATAEAKVVGVLGHTASDIAFDSRGRLYAWLADRQQIGSVDLASGAATPIGPVISAAEPTGGGLAIDEKGIAYVIPGTAAGALYTINLSTLESAAGPPLSGAPYLSAINSIALSSRGRLYGVNSNLAVPARSALVIVNRDSGAVSNVGQLPDDADGLTFSREQATGQPRDESRFPLWVVMVLSFVIGAGAMHAASRWRASRRMP